MRTKRWFETPLCVEHRLQSFKFLESVFVTFISPEALVYSMWRLVIAVTLCATAAGGFEVPFARLAFLQAQCANGLNQRTSTDYTSSYSWHTKQRARCTTRMMAGPNKGQSPSFFADWPVLEAEVKAYLAEREAGESDESNNDGEQPQKRNALLTFLSVDPSAMALEDEPEADQWDGEIDVLAYSELTRYGYGYLIEPMMKSGGFATVSERMGIELNVRTLKDREYYERITPPVALRKAETDGFLTLGRAREERLDAVAEVDREERRKSLFEKQAMMDKAAKAKAQAAKPGLLKPKKEKLSGRTSSEVGEEVFRVPGLPEDQRGPRAWEPPAASDGPPPQPLLLSLPQRVNTVAVVACCALAFGRGTAGALEAGLLPQEVAEVAVPASLFLVGINIASAVAGASLAKSKGRSVSLWVFKGALAGVTSVLELKELADIASPGSTASVASGPGDGNASA